MRAVSEQKTRLLSRADITLDSERYLSTVDRVIHKYGVDRSKLINMLQEIQREFHYLPRQSLEALSNKLGIPLSEILNVATFYHQFRLEPLGTYVIHVCFGTACYLKGSPEIYESIKKALNLKERENTTRDGAITVEKARCFGCCSLAPVIMVTSSDESERYVHGRLNIAESKKVALGYRTRALSNIDEA
ncbi:MAG: NAD(P)H-dependent oxidoreductase subunit E [Zestosphaera sp.]